MDMAQYITEDQRHLSNSQFHESTDMDLTGKVIQRVKAPYTWYAAKMTNSTTKHIAIWLQILMTQQFYVILKIHKNFKNPSGRHWGSVSGPHWEKLHTLWTPLLVPYSTHLSNTLSEANFLMFSFAPWISPVYIQIYTTRNVGHTDNPQGLPHSSYVTITWGLDK